MNYKREGALFVGMDLHKEFHAAVMTDCWGELIATYTVENTPSKYPKFLKEVLRKAAGSQSSLVWRMYPSTAEGWQSIYCHRSRSSRRLTPLTPSEREDGVPVRIRLTSAMPEASVIH